MGKISVKEMQEALKFVDAELDGSDSITLIVAGLLLSKYFAKPEYVVKRVRELKKLAVNIQLDREKEIIMHSTHTLKRFVSEDEESSDYSKGSQQFILSYLFTF